MPAFIVPGFSRKIIILGDEESRHCLKVLRKKTGDVVELTDGAGTRAIARITSTGKRHCELEILEKHFVEPDPYHVHIAIVPVKNQERIEWFVEKATEIGIHEISFPVSEHAERKTVNTERLIKKAASALKQSGRHYLPVIHQAEPFSSWLERHATGQLFIANTGPANTGLLSRVATAGGDYVLLIGPEGGFTGGETELAGEKGFHKVSLGKNVLRTETAGVVGCQMLCEINF